MHHKINNIYWPPQSFYDRLSHIEHERKKFALGSGLMRWALNKKSITVSGAKWIQSVLKIKGHVAHDFLSITISGFTPSVVHVLEHVDTETNHGVPNKTIKQEIWECMCDIGANTLLTNDDELTDVDFRRSMEELRRWLWSADGKKIRNETLKWGSLADCSVDEAYFRFFDDYGAEHIINPYEMKRFHKLGVISKNLHYCDGCNINLPCTIQQADGMRYCRNCLSNINDTNTADCKNLECFFYDCENYYDEESLVNESLSFDFPEDNDDF